MLVWGIECREGGSSVKKNREFTMAKGVALGVAAAIALSLLISSAFAFLIIGERIGESSVFWLGLAIALIASLVGCLIGTGVSPDKPLVTSILIVAGYTIIMMLIGFIAYGNIRDVGFWNVPMNLIAAAATCLIRAGKGRRRYR